MSNVNGSNPFGNPNAGPQLNAALNNVVLCYIVPPPNERLHSSWRAICYTAQKPKKIFHEFKTLVTKIHPHTEIMKQELCDPDHIPAHIIQLTEKDQFVYIEGDICEVLGVEITLADGHKDPYIKRGQIKPKSPKSKKSSIIMPGQQPSNMGQRLPLINKRAQTNSNQIDLSDIYIVDITFGMHSETDQTLVDHVKMIAWNEGLTTG